MLALSFHALCKQENGSHSSHEVTTHMDALSVLVPPTGSHTPDGWHLPGRCVRKKIHPLAT